MSEYYSRAEVAKLLNPNVSVNTIRRMEDSGRMPKHIKKSKDNGFLYAKNEIDDWLITNPKTKPCGRKRSGGKCSITNQNIDVWNLKGRREQIKYTGEMVNLIYFLQPNLRNRMIGNEL